MTNLRSIVIYFKYVMCQTKVMSCSTAMGVDEGPVGKNRSQVRGMQKSKMAYEWCTDSGIIDDISESFPLTSSGSEWSGFTDQVMGGISEGKLLREKINGRDCIVMKVG